MKQINLIERARHFIENKVTYVTSQSSISSVTRRTESHKRAVTILDNKVDSKIRKCKNKDYIKSEDDILAKMVQTQTVARTTVVKKASPSKAKNIDVLPPLKIASTTPW